MQKIISKKIEDELSTLKESYEIKGRKLAETQANLFDLKAQAKQFEAEAEFLRIAQQKTLDSLAESKLSENTAKADLQKYFEEIAVLTRLLEDHRIKKSNYDVVMMELRGEISASAARLIEKDKEIQLLVHDLKEKQNNEKRLKQENQHLLTYKADLLNSTSWRITAPIRRIKRIISR